MDQTLSAILAALYQAHATIDAQQRQITDLEASVSNYKTAAESLLREQANATAASPD